jgi:hypothetical protein
MEPSSEHERQIVLLVDERAVHGHLPLSAVVDIAASLAFIPSEVETHFLVRYILWRRNRRTLL